MVCAVYPATIFNGTPEKRAFAQRIFWNRSGVASAKVKPASYLVVGPRTETRIGSQAQMTPPQSYLPSEQRITLLPGMVQFANGTGIIRLPSITTPRLRLIPWLSRFKPWWQRQTHRLILTLRRPRRQPGGLLPTIMRRSIWEVTRTTSTHSAYGVGLNVTEPLPLANYALTGLPPVDDYADDYYREPVTKLKSTDPSPPLKPFPFDGYYDYDDPATGYRFPDEPFDVDNSRLDSFASVGDLEDSSPIDEFEPENKSNYKTAFLQRLANPLIAYDSVVNPYITVDWLPIDVTVFNGEDGVNDLALEFFESRERNGDGVAKRNLWSQETDEPIDRFSIATTDYFKFTLSHSLGYLNRPYGGTLGVPVVPVPYAGDPANGPFPGWHGTIDRLPIPWS